MRPGGLCKKALLSQNQGKGKRIGRVLSSPQGILNFHFGRANSRDCRRHPLSGVYA